MFSQSMVAEFSRLNLTIMNFPTDECPFTSVEVAKPVKVISIILRNFSKTAGTTCLALTRKDPLANQSVAAQGTRPRRLTSPARPAAILVTSAGGLARSARATIPNSICVGLQPGLVAEQRSQRGGDLAMEVPFGSGRKRASVEQGGSPHSG